MAGDLSSIERSITELTERMQGAQRALSDRKAELHLIEESIAVCKERIGELKEQKQWVCGAERREIREQLDDEYAVKASLNSERSMAKAAVGEASAALRCCRNEATSKLRSVGNQLNLHISNLDRTGHIALPKSAFGAGEQIQAANLGAAQRLQQQVSALKSELNKEESEKDLLSYVPIPGFQAWPEAVKGADGNPTLIRPIDGGRAFCDIGEGVQIPVDYYDLHDTIQPAGSSTQEKEAFGLAYAREYLQAVGHVAIEEIGGPNAPDILSLAVGKGGGLVITEVKGTTIGARIDAMNLTATLADGTVRYENQRNYLSRNGNTVLLRLNREIEDCSDPQRRQGLMAIRSEFARVNQRGFIPGEFETQVVQVGWVDSTMPKAKELRPASLVEGGRWMNYLQEVRPDRVVQLNVHSGSEQACIDDETTKEAAEPLSSDELPQASSS